MGQRWLGCLQSENTQMHAEAQEEISWGKQLRKRDSLAAARRKWVGFELQLSTFFHLQTCK